MANVYENPGDPVSTPDKEVRYVEVKYYTLETIQATNIDNTAHVLSMLRGWDQFMKDSVLISTELRGDSARAFFDRLQNASKSWWRNTSDMAIEAAKEKGNIPGDVKAV